MSYRDGRLLQTTADKPALGDIHPMQRRRLGPLARTVFHVLSECTDVANSEPVVFSSQMGELQRTQGILDAMAADEPVSPTAFSLSVHNAISGLWSMIHDIPAPMVALSPIDGSFIAALIESLGILQEGTYNAVNVVFYEEDYPSFYSPYMTGPTAPYALALRLVTPELAGPSATRLALKVVEEPTGFAAKALPLDLIPVLQKTGAALQVSDLSSHWRLELRS
jgi:hypothetical protein